MRIIFLRNNGNPSFRKSYLKDQVVWKLPRSRDSNSFSDVSLFQYVDFFNDCQPEVLVKKYPRYPMFNIKITKFWSKIYLKVGKVVKIPHIFPITKKVV